jgi:hypothetical protein
VGSRAWRPLLAVVAAVTGALAVTGCVSMPSAGPVLSYPITQETGGQNGQNLQFIVAPPAYNGKPQQIVNGFLTAAAAYGNQQQVARKYLTPQESKVWNPLWAASVYQTVPNVRNPVFKSAGSQPSGACAASAKKEDKQASERAIVQVDGRIQANLSGHGSYAVLSASTPALAPSGPQEFELEQVGGQWRICDAPSELLLTQAQFADDYELRNLYFFDPNDRFLVPDPVYVPLEATTTILTNRLLQELKTPPIDWLAGGATQTAIPHGATVTVQIADNLATVNLTGAITKAQSAEVASQLLWTLVGAGQGGSQVDSVELIVNGKWFYPANSPVDPVQNQTQAKYAPAAGASQPLFYYLDGAGNLYSRVGVAVGGKQVLIAKIGSGYSQIAVSQDGKYLAALRNGELFIGPLGGRLVRQQGSGYETLSWDPTDNLWTTTGDQISVFRAGESPNSRPAKPIMATVTSNGSIVNGSFTALQIAPDGVRVAMVLDSDELTFGAIVWQQGTGPSLGVKIELSPFNVSNLVNGFLAVTWYGPDNVITLGGPGSTLTEYPVNGGASTSQMLDQTVESITATVGQALIAGVNKDGMIEAPTLTGAWAPILTGASTQLKGISPTYPG